MTGLGMRQALGTPPATSLAAWMFTPDLMPFTAAATDTGLLTTRYDTAFAQAPIPGSGNYVYARASNSGTGAQTGTVYLYWAQHNPYAGPSSPLLDPTTWAQSGFSVNGTATNSVSIQAQTAGEVVLAAAPLVWTPTALSSEVNRYVLLAWLDPGGSPPPDFSTMPRFAKLDALRQYVEGQPNLVMLDTAYSGMFARQYLDQSSAVSAPDATWNSSPDLMLYQQPPFDPKLLLRALNWSVHQPPATGAQNNLYLRGFNSSAGSLTTHVSFFYAVNSPTSSPNPLLDPSTWKTCGAVDITSNSPGDQMINTTPVTWQPPAGPPSGSTYAVIAWIDNTGGSNPPPFGSLPAFSSASSFAEYVQGVRNLVLWDGEYDGLFVRQFAGQTAAQAGTGAQTSPDIIVSGVAAAQDTSAYVRTYSAGTLANAVVTGVPNLVYLRVINPNNRAQNARVYLFSGDTATPSVSALSQSGFKVAGQTQNWVDLKADTLNEVLVSTVPIVWVPPPPTKQQFLVTYVDGSANPQPPDFSTVFYVTLAAMTEFIAAQPQLSWVGVTSTKPSPAPTFTSQLPVTVTSGGTYYVGVQFQNMPVDGSFTASMPGPDAADTVVVPSFHPPSPNASVLWKVTYPAGFETSLVLSYWQGATQPENATATLLTLPAPST